MKTVDADFSRSSVETIGERVVALLLVVEAISVFLLWTLDPFTSHGQQGFALYLAADLVAFAMISYIYRALTSEERISKAYIIAGCVFIAVVFFVSLTLPG